MDKENAINGLEHCIYEECSECPYSKSSTYFIPCASKMMKDIWKITEEQEESIKALRETISGLIDTIKDIASTGKVGTCKNCKHRNDRTICPCYRDRYEMDDWFCADWELNDQQGE